MHFRWACPKFLRQTFYDYLALSIRSSPKGEPIMRRREKTHRSHHATVRALAYKWNRIIFRCQQDGKSYDEHTYLRPLNEPASPLIGSTNVNTVGEWKAIAGFKKLSGESLLTE